jgi:hypothetical protein
VQAILIENLGDECEINDGVQTSFLVIANILKLEIAVSVAKLVKDFHLRYELHSHDGHLVQSEAFVLPGVLQAQLHFEHFEDVSARVSHQNLTQRIRHFRRKDYWESTIFLKLQWLNLLENLKFSFEACSLFFELELFQDHFLSNDILLVVFNNSVIVFEVSNKDGCLGALGKDLIRLKVVLM